jgi:hypothetical protein
MRVYAHALGTQQLTRHANNIERKVMTPEEGCTVQVVSQVQLPRKSRETRVRTLCTISNRSQYQSLENTEYYLPLNYVHSKKYEGPSLVGKGGGGVTTSSADNLSLGSR